MNQARKPPSKLTVRLTMASQYVLGCPAFIEVTIANETADTEYYDLTPCDPLSPPFPVELTLTSGRRVVTLPASSSSDTGERGDGFDLAPREARTFVLDISELEPELAPGPWHCQARWMMRHERPRSAAVPVTFTAAEPADLPRLARLRLAGGARTPTWANLVKSPAAVNEETVRALSAPAYQAVLPYLILVRNVHDSEAPATFPLDLLDQHTQGPWASEAHVLSFELRWVRRARDLAQHRAALFRRWPGVTFRVEEVEAGLGLLTTLRHSYGGKRSVP